MPQASRHKFRVFLLVAAAVFAAAVFFALSGDGRGGYWSDHPMLGSLVSGALLAVFIGAVVERWLERREEQRWHAVARLACHTLGDSVTRPIINALTGLLVGPSNVLDPVDLSQSRGYPSDQQPAMHRSALPLSWPAGSTAWLDPYALRAGELVSVERLARLLQEQEWLRVAIDYLRVLRHETREVLAPWASVMITADEPRRLLNYAALLNDELGYLRVEMEHLLALRESGDDSAAAERRLVLWWQLLDARARLLTNAFWDTAGSEEYSYWLPELVADAGVDAAFADLDVKGAWPGAYAPAIGTWVPSDSPRDA